MAGSLLENHPSPDPITPPPTPPRSGEGRKQKTHSPGPDHPSQPLPEAERGGTPPFPFREGGLGGLGY